MKPDAAPTFETNRESWAWPRRAASLAGSGRLATHCPPATPHVAHEDSKRQACVRGAKSGAAPLRGGVARRQCVIREVLLLPLGRCHLRPTIIAADCNGPQPHCRCQLLRPGVAGAGAFDWAACVWVPRRPQAPAKQPRALNCFSAAGNAGRFQPANRYRSGWLSQEALPAGNVPGQGPDVPNVPRITGPALVPPPRARPARRAAHCRSATIPTEHEGAPSGVGQGASGSVAGSSGFSAALPAGNGPGSAWPARPSTSSPLAGRRGRGGRGAGRSALPIHNSRLTSYNPAELFGCHLKPLVHVTGVAGRQCAAWRHPSDIAGPATCHESM